MSGDKWQPLSGAVPFTPGQASVIPSKPAPSAPAEHYISRRAHTLWERMRIWYPNKLAEHPPADYCKLIDACSREKLAACMSNMKTRHLTWPPTFPEFAKLFVEQNGDAESINWPLIIDSFASKLIAAGAITDEQRRRITWHGIGGTPGVALKYTGCSVPAIGTAPARTFRLDEWVHRE